MERNGHKMQLPSTKRLTTIWLMPWIGYIYTAKVSSSQGTKTYIGSTETSFKQRYANHKQSLEKRAKSTQTSLSKYVWELKDQQIEHSIKWQIIKRSSPYKCGSRYCDLCISEKFFILTADPLACINKNSELMQKCRHRNKFKLCRLPPPGPVLSEGVPWVIAFFSICID